MSSAIITGGAVRLGRSMAVHLAKQGYNIALHYNCSEGPAKQVQEEILSAGVRCSLFACDFNDPDQVETLIPRIVADFSDIDLLINSAANFIQENVENTSLNSLLQSIHTNLLAPFLLMRDYKKLINRGMVVNILDERIQRNIPTFAAYSVAKVGLSHLTHLAAIEWGEEVRVNAIAPGLILPPAGETDEYLLRATKNNPLKTHGSLNNILCGLDFLIDNRFVNGETLFIDGGESKCGYRREE
jgi:NAD(P)-dependent dehydrogenase (short-subunit alcohol dehydrogenase family)